MPRTADPEEDTPCPVRTSSLGNARNHDPLAFHTSFDDDDDDTLNLDFTCALPDTSHGFQLQKLAPKSRGLKEPPRRKTFVPPPQKSDPAPVMPVKDRTATPYLPPRAQQQQQHHQTKLQEEQKPSLGLQQQPKRPGFRAVTGVAARRRISALVKAKKDEQEAQEQAMRGAREKEKMAAVEIEARPKSPPVDIWSRAAGPALSKPPRQAERKIIAPSKRPLQTTKGIQQQTQTNAVRMPSFGKENVPPGGVAARKKRSLSSPKAPVPKQRPKPARSSGSSSTALKLPQPSKAMPPPQSSNSKITRKRAQDSMSEDDHSYSSDMTFHSDISKGSTDSYRSRKRPKRSLESLPSPPSLTAEEEAELRPPPDFLAPGLIGHQSRRPASRKLDPVLSEDLSRCEMYEESWLAAQEASVHQLLNHLIAQYSPIPTGKPRKELRREMLTLYSSAPFPTVYKRVHASLQFGALSITQSTLDKSASSKFVNGGQGWGLDVGLRQRYLELFVGSYERQSLITALEVVVGRDMFANACPGESERKIMETFITRYLINSEDLLAATQPEPPRNRRGVPIQQSTVEDEDKGTPAWLLRRSLLRSLLLILLLDKMKARGIMGRQCLFQTSSPHKSSNSVLIALARLLLPSMGDVVKPLRYINYNLESTQDPLSEFDFTINNIAVDLRDGVRLSRVVEVLRGSKNRLSGPSSLDDEQGDIFFITPRLQYPAISRAQKLHNVNLMLSHIDNVHNVQAKHIVDGHREITVGLLWTLLTQGGLDLLVDWDAVKSEISRLKAEADQRGVKYRQPRLPASTPYYSLMETWARLVAEKHGLKVLNLTTSFADGAVFAAIVSEYEQFLPSLAKQDPNASLEIKLRGIGCNSYFASLFSPSFTGGYIFKQDFVVSSLSYLCSRLLQPSIPERAARIIQRAFRNYLFRHNIHKRIHCLLLAHDCATFVNSKQKILDAATTIQRAYRRYLKIRIDALVTRMVGLQSAIRGMLMRRFRKSHVRAVVLLQRRWREIREQRYLERIGVAKEAITGVQSIARGKLVRDRFEIMRNAVITIQQQYRQHKTYRDTREHYLHLQSSATKIQRTWRRYLDTRDERAVFIDSIAQIEEIQSTARGFLARKRFNSRHSAAITLQTWFRGTLEFRRQREFYLSLHATTIFIQRRRRETLLARDQRTAYVGLKSAVALLETTFLTRKKKTNAAIILQRAWRSRSWLIKLRRKMVMVVTIQRVWRGWRQRQKAGPRLRVIRKRLAKIEKRGVREEERLRARVVVAVEMLGVRVGFGRGVAMLDFLAATSNECTHIISTSPTVIPTILSTLCASLSALTKPSPTASTIRSILTSISLLTRICVLCPATILMHQAPKTGDDLLDVMLVIMSAVKSATAGSQGYEVLMAGMKMLVAVSGHAEVWRTVKKERAKWVEKVREVVEEIGTKGIGKRGGRGRGTEEVVGVLLERLVR